jgi:hypothetical protein
MLVDIARVCPSKVCMLDTYPQMHMIMVFGGRTFGKSLGLDEIVRVGLPGWHLWLCQKKQQDLVWQLGLSFHMRPLPCYDAAPSPQHIQKHKGICLISPVGPSVEWM